MFYVYAIQSKSGRVYIGQTQDLKERVAYHNNGYVKSTRNDRDWVVIKTKKFENRNEARFFERQLKKSRGRRLKWLDS